MRKRLIIVSTLTIVLIGASSFGYYYLWNTLQEGQYTVIEDAMVKHYNSADCVGLHNDFNEVVDVDVTLNLGAWVAIQKYFISEASYKEMRETEREYILDDDVFSVVEHYEKNLKICNFHDLAESYEDVGSGKDKFKTLFDALVESKYQLSSPVSFYDASKPDANASQLYKKTQDFFSEILADFEYAALLGSNECGFFSSIMGRSDDEFTESFSKVLPDIYMTCAINLYKETYASDKQGGDKVVTTADEKMAREYVQAFNNPNNNPNVSIAEETSSEKRARYAHVRSVYMYEHVINKYPDSQVVKNNTYNLMKAITKSTLTCDEFVLSHSVFNKFPEKLNEETTYRVCAVKYDKAERYREAVALFQHLVDAFPDSPFKLIAEKRLADASFNLAKKVGSGKIEQPVALPSGDGKTYVAVANKTADGVSFILRGSDNIRERLLSVKDCNSRESFTFIEVNPGYYDVLADSDRENVKSFTGKWVVAKGKTYPLCLYLISEKERR